VALLAESNALLVASLEAPKTLAEVIATAKAKPDALQFGSSGNGTFTHLYGELLNLQAGTQIGHVPYRGSTQVLTDIMAGRLALGFITAAPILPSIKAGRARALATTGTKRSPALPEVPTFAEVGVSGFEAGLWFGLNTTAGTPRATIERLNREVMRIMGSTEMHEVLARQGIDSTPSSAQAFDAFIVQDTARWARVVRAAGVKMD
jgi:tripartite-type tricarboxylate transporter receptor subunit TctC